MKKLLPSLFFVFLMCVSTFADDYYWVGGSGNWTDYATHWATTSGGSTFHTQAPASSDNVYFDANSFTAASQVVTVDANAICADMDWTGALNDPEFYGTTSRILTIHGSITLIENMNFNFLGSVYFESISSGETITSAGQSFKHNVYFNNIGGWVLQDGFEQTGDYIVYLNKGTLDLNDMPFTVNRFNSRNTNNRKMIMGDSIMTIASSSSYAFDFRGENFIFQCDSSLIRFTGADAYLLHYGRYGPGLTFFNMIFEAATGNSSARNEGGSFNLLTFNSNGTVKYGNTIDTLIFAGNGTISSNGNSINVVKFNADAEIANNGTYGEVTIKGNGNITGSNTIENLMLSAGKTYTFDDGDNQLITGTFTADGSCDSVIVIKSDSETAQTTLSKNSGSVTINYCMLQGINATGGATFTANNTVDLGNNSGWAITPPGSQDYFWIGGTGNWNDPTKWSSSSGGTAANCIPNPTDNVFFDANSFSAPGQTVTIIGDNEDKAYCHNMTWTGATNNPSLAGANPNTLNIYGSLTLISGMSYDFSGETVFKATSTGKTITTAGIALDNNAVFFDGEGGEWTLQDALDLGTQKLDLVRGSLISNNQDIDVGKFFSRYQYTRALTLGSTEMTISWTNQYAFDFRGENFTFNAGTSTIRFTGANAGIYHYRYAGNGLSFYDVIFEAATSTAYVSIETGSFNLLTFNSAGRVNGGNNIIDTLTFAGDGMLNTNGNNINVVDFNSNATIAYEGTYGKVTIAGDGSITHDNTFDTLVFTAGKQYTLTANKTQIIQNELIANGSGTQYIIIKSSSEGTQTTLSKTSGNITVSYVSLQDNNATGGATFTANNSIDLGNNTGWTINSPPPTNYYWVGGTGNWDDTSEWSLTSGGAGGAGVPLPVDNAIFDANSFSAPGQVVTMIGDASNTIKVKDMNWTGATNNPTLAGASDQTLRIYGSLTLISGMSFTFDGPVYFAATTTGQTITTAGILLDNNSVYFDGVGGEWTLQDSLNTGSQTLYHENGSLITNNNPLTVSTFSSYNQNTRALTLGSSVMTITSTSSSAFIFRGENFTFDAGTSTIRFTGSGGGLNHYTYTGSGLDFYDMIFEAASGISTAQNQSGTFNNLIFNSTTGYVFGGNTIDSLVFNGDGIINSYGNNINNTVFNASATINNNGTYGKVIMNGSGNITNDNTFDTLVFTAGNQYTLTYNKTQTIQHKLIAEGTDADVIVINSSSAGSQSTFSKTSGSVTVNYVSLQDNNATGGATFTANNSTDLGNNTGWTINSPPPTNYYWVGGTGNYNDASNWSLTTGGAGGAGVPTANDNVFFDANSFSAAGQVVTVIGDASNIARANNMNWTGATNNPELAGASSQSLYIHGSMTLISDMSYTFAGPVYFAATTTEQTITTAGILLDNNSVYFDGVGGEWTLQDSLNTGSQTLYHENGSLITNNNPLTVSTFRSNNQNTRALTLGSSVMTITSTSSSAFIFRGENFTFDAGTSTIRFTGSGGGLNHHYYYGSGLDFYDMIFEAASGISTAKNQSGTFNNLIFNSTTGYVYGGNTIDSLVFNGDGIINSDGNNINNTVFNASATINNDGTYGKVIMNGSGNITNDNTFDTLVFTAGNTYTLTSGSTQSIQDTLIATGTCNAYIDIHASTSYPATFSKASGIVTVYYCEIQWVTATGGATFNAQNCVDQGNNSGWAFTTVPLDLYWVGGTGNWDDVNHWAASSGGTGGYCIPTQSDNVYFDNNSFTQAGQSVTINVASASCHNMDWTGAAYSPTFTSTAPSNNLNIHGLLKLIQNMNFAFSGSVYFEGQSPSPTYNVTLAGNSLNNDVYFNGSGGNWTLQDDLSTGTNNVYLNHGTLNTNGQTVSMSRFYSSNDNTRALNLGSSVINVSSGSNTAWQVTGSNFTITPGTSEIRFTTANGGFSSLGASDLKYHNVLFQNLGGSATISSDDSIHKVTFNPTGSITGGGAYDYLVMNVGGQLQGNSSYGSVQLYGNTTINGVNTFGRLLLGSGYSFTFQSGSTQTITGRFIIWGTASRSITIKSSSAGTQATISKAAGTVLGNYILLKDMVATGGATFDLYSSTDNGNNTGWNFLAGTYYVFPNTTITPGPQQCYEATETITVAGSGKTFTVQNGGSVKLIAGNLIEFLPGTSVVAGGYMNAYITPYGFFCDTLSTMPIAPQNTFTEIQEDALISDGWNNAFFRIYPNPTNGIFTLEMKEVKDQADISIEISNLMGECVVKSDMPASPSYQIDLTGKQRGVYLVRVVLDNRMEVKKLIKQ